MGLDIYFYKRKFSLENPNKTKGKKGVEKMEEIAYFRKVNFLMSHFCYADKCLAEGDKNGDCTYVPITDEEVDWLIDDCNETLKKAEGFNFEDGATLDESEIPLHPQPGFFFGSTDLDEDFIEAVKEVRKTFKKIKKNLKDDEEMFMFASW